MIEISSELYGDTVTFDTLEEAQQAIRACGSDFVAVTLHMRGRDVVNEDGDLVGLEIEVIE